MWRSAWLSRIDLCLCCRCECDWLCLLLLLFSRVCVFHQLCCVHSLVEWRVMVALQCAGAVILYIYLLFGC